MSPVGRPRPLASAIWSSFTADPALPSSLQNQIVTQFQAAVLSASVPPGSRLPSSRALAEKLGVSRQTVILAYERLVAEGYVEGRPGAGMFASTLRPDERTSLRPQRPGAPGDTAPAMMISRRGRAIVDLVAAQDLSPARPKPALLMPGTPALDAFPARIWSRLSAQFWRQAHGPDILGYADPAGYLPLRQAIAAYLAETRGIVCDAADIVVTAGAQQAISLAARLLSDPGDVIWVENPTNIPIRTALTACGAKICAVPVDQEGIDIAAGEGLAARPKVIVVTPSRQYPLGVTMSLGRRRALIDLAERTGAWIIEDDYDSDYTFRGLPILPLRSLAGRGIEAHVIYVGTSSKTLAPGMRIGFLVAPQGLARTFATARHLDDRQPPGPEQAVLAAFIAQGHLASHIRRMRLIYRGRRDALLAALALHCGDLLEWDVTPPDSGLHLVTRFRQGRTAEFEHRVCEKALLSALRPLPLSSFWHQAARDGARPGLLIGFSFPSAGGMPYAAELLRQAIRDAEAEAGYRRRAR
jgi:GntR family transcriptional regulator/MocR family aminotransferase